MFTIKSELARVLAIIGGTMQNYQTDLLYDFASALNKFEYNEDYTMFVWKSGTHSLDTYKAICKDDGKEDPTIEDCVNVAKRTLGVDYIVTIKKDENHIKVELKNIDMDKSSFLLLESNINNFLELIS